MPKVGEFAGIIGPRATNDLTKTRIWLRISVQFGGETRSPTPHFAGVHGRLSVETENAKPKNLEKVGLDPLKKC